MTTVSAQPRSGAAAGDLLRDWRRRRRLSQLELSSLAGVSTRHLSFVETGRGRASRELVTHLAAVLDVPLRERNTLLLAAGFAPAYAESTFHAPELDGVREAMQGLLLGHDPNPALVMNRRFELLAANRSLSVLTEGIAEHLLSPPVNVMRATLHPDGLAQRMVNHGEYREHLLHMLSREMVASGDPDLARLHSEVSAYPYPPVWEAAPDTGAVLPLKVRHDGGELVFFSIFATFGSARDVAVAELVIESMFPADKHTTEVLHARAAQWQDTDS